MPKLSKSRISEALNLFFETDIDWTKLSKKELTQIIQKVDDTDFMLKKHFSNSDSQRDSLMELTRERAKTVAMDTGTKLIQIIDEKRPLNMLLNKLAEEQDPKNE